MIEEIAIDAPIYDHKAIAREFVKAAIADLNAARERDYEAWLEDQRAMARLERSAATRRGWQGRKARLRGATSPVDANPDAWVAHWP